MKTIIFTIIGLIIYDLIKKLFNVIMIKRNKEKLNMIINNMVDKMDMNKKVDDYWGNDLKKSDFEREKNRWI